MRILLTVGVIGGAMYMFQRAFQTIFKKVYGVSMESLLEAYREECELIACGEDL